MPRLLFALVTLALIATPATALAQQPQTNAPPGNSAIDEYLETVPGASGNQRPRSPGAGPSGGLTAAQRADLQRLGSDGRALADAVDATSPAREVPRKSTPAPPDARSRSPLSEVFDATTGRDGGAGMGALLPAILLAALLGIVALVAVRRRSASQ